MRPSAILFYLARRLLFTKFRDPGENPRLHLFVQLKRIVREWIDGGYPRCTGGTYPALLMYRTLPIAPVSASLRRLRRHLSASGRSRRRSHPTTPSARRACQFHDVEEASFSDGSAPLSRQSGGLRQRLGGRVLPCARAEPTRPSLCQELGFEVPYLLGATPKNTCPTSP